MTPPPTQQPQCSSVVDAHCGIHYQPLENSRCSLSTDGEDSSPSVQFRSLQDVQQTYSNVYLDFFTDERHQRLIRQHNRHAISSRLKRTVESHFPSAGQWFTVGVLMERVVDFELRQTLQCGSDRRTVRTGTASTLGQNRGNDESAELESQLWKVSPMDGSDHFQYLFMHGTGSAEVEWTHGSLVKVIGPRVLCHVPQFGVGDSASSIKSSLVIDVKRASRSEKQDIHARAMNESRVVVAMEIDDPQRQLQVLGTAIHFSRCKALVDDHRSDVKRSKKRSRKEFSSGDIKALLNRERSCKGPHQVLRKRCNRPINRKNGEYCTLHRSLAIDQLAGSRMEIQGATGFVKDMRTGYDFPFHAAVYRVLSDTATVFLNPRVGHDPNYHPVSSLSSSQSSSVGSQSHGSSDRSGSLWNKKRLKPNVMQRISSSKSAGSKYFIEQSRHETRRFVQEIIARKDAKQLINGTVSAVDLDRAERLAATVQMPVFDMSMSGTVTLTLSVDNDNDENDKEIDNGSSTTDTEQSDPLPPGPQHKKARIE